MCCIWDGRVHRSDWFCSKRTRPEWILIYWRLFCSLKVDHAPMAGPSNQLSKLLKLTGFRMRLVGRTLSALMEPISPEVPAKTGGKGDIQRSEDRRVEADCWWRRRCKVMVIYQWAGYNRNGCLWWFLLLQEWSLQACHWQSGWRPLAGTPDLLFHTERLPFSTVLHPDQMRNLVEEETKSPRCPVPMQSSSKSLKHDHSTL